MWLLVQEEWAPVALVSAEMACFPVGWVFLDLLDQFVVLFDQSEALLDQLEISPVEDMRAEQEFAC